MNNPEKAAGTAAGSVSSTASIAASGANRMTLNPRYAAAISNTRAPKAMSTSANAGFR